MNEENHPYWKIYQRIITLRGTAPGRQSDNHLDILANECRFSFVEKQTSRFLFALQKTFGSYLEEKYFCKLREIYGYSVMSPPILKIIAEYSPLVELGAGNGYISYLLQNLGADLVPLERFPVEEGKNWFFNTSNLGLPSKGGKSWTPVIKGEATSLKQYQSRNLLLCWPARNLMANEALEHFPGKRLILVADKTCCGNKSFYENLARDWILELRVNTESWSMCHSETLEIYKRCA